MVFFWVNLHNLVRIAFNKSLNYKRNPKVFYFPLSPEVLFGMMANLPSYFTNFEKKKNKTLDPVKFSLRKKRVRMN